MGPTATSSLPDSELAARAVAVLLNRVDGIDDWYYFQFPETAKLQLAGGDLLADGGKQLLEDLKPVDGGYEHPGNPSPSPLDALKAVLAAFRVREDVARRAFKRIFDTDVIENDSDAFKGFLGWMNRSETKRRAAWARRRLRSKRCREGVISVVAEGDSWFQFPRIVFYVVKDVIYHLSRQPDMCVYTHAAGGDWLSNMLMSQQYVSALSKVEPDVFLFSGGGNDLLGDGRLGNMVRRRRDEALPAAQSLADLRNRQVPDNPDRGRFETGLRYAGEEFFQFMNLVFVQYLLFIWNIRRAPNLQRMAIITQGYDHVIPKRRIGSPPFQPQRLVNGLMNSGKWLWDPLETKGVPDADKPHVVYAMIQEFNEMLISLQAVDGLGPLYHVDSRGVAQGDNANWFDEIHLKSEGFRKVAERYAECIREHLNTPDPAS